MNASGTPSSGSPGRSAPLLTVASPQRSRRRVPRSAVNGMKTIGTRVAASSRFEHLVFLDVPVDGHSMSFVQPANQLRELPELLVERHRDFVMELVPG